MRSTHHAGRTGAARDPFVLLALRVLGDAPAPLRRRVVAVTIADGALTIYLHRGPRLIFGNGALPHAKWDAAAAVLADAQLARRELHRRAAAVAARRAGRGPGDEPSAASTRAAAVGARRERRDRRDGAQSEP